MEFVELTPSERIIIQELRSLKPFERIEVSADKDGKPGVYIVTRSSRAILVVGTMNYTK